jgi:hypothetical protein
MGLAPDDAQAAADPASGGTGVLRNGCGLEEDAGRQISHEGPS